jgi:DUF4097 and DUF4098 domain-containing protein YvlB
MNATTAQAQPQGRFSTFFAVSVAISITAAFLAMAPTSFAFSQTYQRDYRLEFGGRFELTNVNGSIQIDGWERDEVEVRAEKSTPGDERDLDRVFIEVESDKSHVSVRTRYPHDAGVDVNVEYHVLVPYHVMLTNVATVNGNVIVRGISGGGELRSVNGNLDITESSGRFSERTMNGNVRLKLRQLTAGDAPMRLETVNGSVVLSLPKDARADLYANSTNGELHSELPVSTGHAAESGGRQLHVTLGSGGGPIVLRNVNGGIWVVREEPSV